MNVVIHGRLTLVVICEICFLVRRVLVGRADIPMTVGNCLRVPEVSGQIVTEMAQLQSNDFVHLGPFKGHLRHP